MQDNQDKKQVRMKYRIQENTKKNPTWAWTSVCCECCVLSGRGLWFGPIFRPEECYRLWCATVYDLVETSMIRRPWPALGCYANDEG